MHKHPNSPTQFLVRSLLDDHGKTARHRKSQNLLGPRLISSNRTIPGRVAHLFPHKFLENLNSLPRYE